MKEGGNDESTIIT